MHGCVYICRLPRYALYVPRVFSSTADFGFRASKREEWFG